MALCEAGSGGVGWRSRGRIVIIGGVRGPTCNLLGHDVMGAAVAAWPAVALVGSYEQLMMVICGSQAVPDGVSGSQVKFTRLVSSENVLSASLSWR